VLISLEKNIAGFEHALHIRQSTMGSVITECVKVDRHLQRKRQTLCCSDGTADSADGDGVDIEVRTCGSIHSKSKRCEPALVGFEQALGEADGDTARQLRSGALLVQRQRDDFVARDRARVTGACEAYGAERFEEARQAV
jgi:hypothetical protein